MVMPRITGTAWRILVAALGVVGLMLPATAPIAGAAGRGEVQRGVATLDAVDKGQRTCADLRSRDFEAVGEFAMQRMVGSAQGHEAMDRAMTQMMGSSGLGSMHRFMGQRFTGCARGPAPRGIAGIAGMMGMMGGSGRGYGPGMTGGFASGSGNGPGMMDGAFGARGNDHHDGWGSAAVVWAVLVGVGLVAVAGTALAFRRRGPKPPASSASEVLNRRFASGEIDSDEYRRRRAALGGADG